MNPNVKCIGIVLIVGHTGLTMFFQIKSNSANENLNAKALHFLFFQKYQSKLHTFSEIKKSAQCADFTFDVGHTGFEPVTSTLSR